MYTVDTYSDFLSLLYQIFPLKTLQEIKCKKQPCSCNIKFTWRTTQMSRNANFKDECTTIRLSSCVDYNSLQLHDHTEQSKLYVWQIDYESNLN